MQPFHVTVCGTLDAGDFDTKNLQEDLKLNLCLFTAIVIDELEILRYDYLQVREVTTLCGLILLTADLLKITYLTDCALWFHATIHNSCFTLI